MRFVPNYTLNVADEAAYPAAITDITKALDACRVEGFVTSHDGKPLYYEYFLAEQSRGSVVVVHGLSEFTKKFYELAFHLLNQGYNVFLFDQRCHGLSFRLTDRIDLIHVDDFDDYVRDLSIFIETIVTKADDVPLYLYSHSMGGAVAALYLAAHPDTVARAVLTAPLFDPVVGTVSSRTARIGLRVAKALCGSKAKFSFSQEFHPDAPYRASHRSSRARYENNMAWRRSDPHYQSTPMTNGWVYNSLLLRRTIVTDAVAGAIRTPLLLFSSERDTVVKNDAQHAFAALCGACRLVTVKDASHSVLTGDRELITEHLSAVLSFYAS